MNRVQKKCFAFSIGLHGLLAVILFGSAAFRNRAEEPDAPILSLIPANILDRAGVGGGEPAPAVRAPQAQPAPQPQIQAVAPRPQTEPQVVEPQPVRRVERQKPQETEEETRPLVAAENPLPRPSKPRHQHEIHPTFGPAAHTAEHATSEAVQASSQVAARSESRRLNEIENSLDHLASGVQSSGAARTVVDIPGIGGGGEVFAGYRDIVRSVYYRAWIAPENGGDKSALPEARIVVARDGSIISAELVSPSGEATLDKSISRALRAVTKLPPFPASAHDEQRTFRIQFSLDLKEAS
ncbi:MAG TPA: TonB family protein [Candidatus Baltobacteraceae bacterium]|jgi:TonB family protein|nr:TonB family protein [Candidatus Baltobacteraceae bacterium]